VTIAVAACAIAACRKSSPADAKEVLVEVDSGTDEPSRLCHEIHPCPRTRPDVVPYLCSLGGERIEPARYAAPGVRIERLFCRYAKIGEDLVIGVPLDGSPHLTGADLFARVRGSPAERARAAAELLLERSVDDACAVTEDGDVLRFCVRHGTSAAGVLRCLVYPTGALSCTRDGTRHALTACRHALGEDRIIAEEPTETHLGKVYGAFVIPSDRLHDGASAIEVRSSDLHLRSAWCHGDRTRWGQAWWGEAPDGRLWFGKDLLPHVDDVTARAGIALALALPSRDGPWLIGPPVGASSPRGCTLAPAPRQTGDAFEAFATSYKGMERCRVSVATLDGACAPIARGTFCE
jgi:hypothetical protein